MQQEEEQRANTAMVELTEQRVRALPLVTYTATDKYALWRLLFLSDFLALLTTPKQNINNINNIFIYISFSSLIPFLLMCAPSFFLLSTLAMVLDYICV